MNGSFFIRARRAALIAMVVTWATPAVAGAPWTHDGFMLRLTLGLGYEDLSLGERRTDIDISGFGASFSATAGGVIAPDFAIHGSAFGLAAVDPNYSLNGRDVETLGIHSAVSLAGLAIGVTYWFMPLNIYLSPSIGVAKTSFELEGDEAEIHGKSDFGFVFRLVAGKEWWVATAWGIGVMAEFTWANVPVEVDSWSASFLGFNVGVSATFN